MLLERAFYAQASGDPVLDGGKCRIEIAPGLVPVERLRALIALLYPDEMTPQAKHLFELVIEEHELAR